MKNTLNRYGRRLQIVHMMHPAWSSVGVMFRLLSRVARLVYKMGRIELTDCSCSSVVSRPLVLASKSWRNVRDDVSITVSQSGRTRIGGDMSSARIARATCSVESIKSNLAPFLSRTVVKRMHLALLDWNLQ